MLKMRRLKWLTVVIFALLGTQHTIASSANAAEPVAAAEPIDHSSPTDSPQQTVEIFHAGLLEIMKHAKELGFQGRINELEPLMARCFDLDFMASKTVGRYWKELSDEDRLRWAAIFTRFTTANYAGRFTGYTGENLSPMASKMHRAIRAS